MPRIPISADPAAALQGLNQIKRKLEELGQTGKKVSDIDLSMPGLGEAAESAKTINRNFEELLKVHRELNRRINATGQQGVPVYDLDFDRMYPGGGAQRARERVAAHVTRGTPYYVDPGGGSGGAGGGGASAGGFVSGAAKYFKPMMALAGIGAFGAMANKSLGYAQDEAMGTDTLRRSVNGLNTDFITFRDRIRESSDGLLVSYREMVKLTQSYTKASAVLDGRGEGTRTAVGFGRSFGMDPGASARLFGQAQFLGGQHTTPKQMAAMFADAVAGSGMFAKSDEMISYVVRFMDSQARSMGGVANIGAYISQLAGMNAFGTENDLPGLKGSAGASLLDRMNQSIQQGGVKGDASRNYIFRAIGGGSGGMDAFKAAVTMQKGLFAKVGGKTVLQLVTDRLLSDPNYKGDINKLGLAGHAVFGASAPNMISFFKEYQKNRGDGFDLASKYADSHNLKNMSPTGFMGLSRVLYAGNRGGDSLAALKDQFLGDDRVSDSNKNRIRGASGDLRDVLADIAAHTNMQRTPGSQTLDAIKNLEKSMTASGNALLAPTNAIKDATAGTLNYIKLIANQLFPGSEQVSETMKRYLVGPEAKQISPFAESNSGLLTDIQVDAINNPPMIAPGATSEGLIGMMKNGLKLEITVKSGGNIKTHRVGDGAKIEVPTPDAGQ